MLTNLKPFSKAVFAAVLLIAPNAVWSLSHAAQSQQTATAMEKKIDKKMVRPETQILHDKWANLLAKHMTTDSSGLARFNYAKLSTSPEDMQKLSTYIQGLSEQKPSTFERKQAMVYWANLYNAVTVQVVSENYPVSSILKIKSGIRPGPWKRKLVTVEGKRLSLDNIEHDIMRPTFKTPLVHYMVNCASIGCPNLKDTPWLAETLDEEADIAARAYVNSARGVTVQKGKVKASKIFKWFKEDFGGDQASILAHIRKYANNDLLAKLEGQTKIRGYVYDWSINE